jgi:predicted nucleic acid-binding Zn ribbon protein
MQKLSDPPPRTCTECGSEKMAKLVSRTAFQLKGGGWYADLYGSPRKDAKGAEAGKGGEPGKGAEPGKGTEPAARPADAGAAPAKAPAPAAPAKAATAPAKSGKAD